MGELWNLSNDGRHSIRSENDCLGRTWIPLGNKILWRSYKSTVPFTVNQYYNQYLLWCSFIYLILRKQYLSLPEYLGFSCWNFPKPYFFQHCLSIVSAALWYIHLNVSFSKSADGSWMFKCLQFTIYSDSFQSSIQQVIVKLREVVTELIVNCRT